VLKLLNNIKIKVMETTKLLSQEVLGNIKGILEEQLLKRGITAPIIRIEEVERRDSNSLTFETSTFQTTPVVFKTLKVTNFGSWIIAEEEGFTTVAISAHYSYTHFNGGSNLCSLFDFRCKVKEGRLYDIQIS
jgi:hypothetical protein